MRAVRLAHALAWMQSMLISTISVKVSITYDGYQKLFKSKAVDFCNVCTQCAMQERASSVAPILSQLSDGVSLHGSGSCRL
jgi:hypothetical protein